MAGLPTLTYGFAPYCGSPPRPDVLLTRWNLDPVLLAALALLLVAYAAMSAAPAGRRSRQPGWRRACFYAGWGLGSLALVSPLCPLSVSLFSARVGQHMLLASVVAPLVALGRPWRVYGAALPRSAIEFCGRLEASAPVGELAAAGAFAAVLWFWHAPGPYTRTFTSDLAYWLMHVTVFGTACWFWATAFDAAAKRLGGFVVAILATTVQMGLLGALITFAPDPLYPPHALTTWAWGLTPLQDQQLGGAIMWVPAGAIFLAAVLVALALAMRRAETLALARAAP